MTTPKLIQGSPSFGAAVVVILAGTTPSFWAGTGTGGAGTAAIFSGALGLILAGAGLGPCAAWVVTKPTASWLRTLVQPGRPRSCWLIANFSSIDATRPVRISCP